MILCANPSAQFQSYQDEIEAAVLRVLRGKQFILGAEVAALEEEFASYIGVKHCVGVANGTDAIELALRAVDIGPGDEVITVSHTAVATVAAIEAAGAVPVLVDVEDYFYTLDPSQLNEVFTSKTRAVIVVHLYGQAANLEPISAFCQQHNLVFIEDCSQAHGATWNREKLGSIGHIGCFSCYPTKNLGAAGDAGLVVTNDKDLAIKIRCLREYGWTKRYVSEISGRNSRLDEVQAAILRVKLKYLENDNDRRRKLAKEYGRFLPSSIHPPKVREISDHVFHLYVVQTTCRDALISFLAQHNIGAAVHYPTPVHLQPAYKNRLRTAKRMSVTERLSGEVLSLPLYPELQIETVQTICRIVASYFSPLEQR
jgi:dTDP-4-amino-4,6-dideoxygalactose transaminase